jgi:DNA-binding CsgD family transcriptional regulator
MCNAVRRAQRNLELESLIRQRLALKQIAGQLRVSLKTVRC